MKKYKKIYIEITNNCNLSCYFCSPIKRSRRNMTKEEFEEILKKIKDYTDYIYLHVKGEPLLHKDIITFIHLAAKYQLKVNLTTNGTLFPALAKELSTCENLNKINFSLHCENDIPSYFEKIFDSVKYLSKKTTVIYRLWTLKENELDEKSTKIVEKIQDYYQLSQETVEKIKKERNSKITSTIYVDKDNEFIWPTINNHKSMGHCYGLKTHIGILVDGTVVPCCLDSSGVMKLGNIFDTDMETIITSKRYQDMLLGFRNRCVNEELCKKCSFKDRLVTNK